MGLIRICLRGLPHSTRLMVGDKESPYDLSLRVLPHSTMLMVGDKESPYGWSALWGGIRECCWRQALVAPCDFVCQSQVS